MFKRFLILIICSTLFLFALPKPGFAGFGISPPYVKSDRLNPGSHFEQVITLLRSDAEEELEATITINAPEIEPWLSIDEGTTFTLPKDKLRVPMTVNVDVPSDAPLGYYSGHINVRISPKQLTGGGVAVALGARIDIDLTLTEETFPEFMVRSVRIPDFEVLTKPWNWKFFSWFFYRIRLVMRIENTGNVPTAPSKVEINVYDLSEKYLLESSTDTSFKQIEPFTTESIEASFPTKLGAGQYWGKIKIYKANEIIHNNKIAFTIAEPGTLKDYMPNLGIWPWLLMASVIVAGLNLILILIKLKFWRFLYKALLFLSWPLRYLYWKFRIIFKYLKERFWGWIHKKSTNYVAKNKANDRDKR